MIEIRVKQTPFRNSLSKKEPTDVFVQLQNRGLETEMVSLVIETNTGLSLDGGGLKTRHEYRIAELPPDGRKEFYIQVFPKPIANLGENPFRLTLTEHFNSWDLVKRKAVLNESILVTR